ncbi:hypothetical protein [Pedobacter psychroterrae]|uniref:hypothetical protein n=1 Tax=Pedobacter psychroterrae TaxID=2530453 RepID=UPI00103BCD04|nr:hypothetical protein [Pedobacter psychroterrae]
MAWIRTGDEETLFKKKGKKGKRNYWLPSYLRARMAAPPFGTCLRSGLVSHVSGAFFFVLFSLEKSSVEDRTGGRGNRFFNP